MTDSVKFVIPTKPGDPISSLFLDGKEIVAGTFLGEVVYYDIGSNKRRILAGFSDEAIRGLLIQDRTVYATVGDLYCRQIRIQDPLDQLEMKFNRRSTSSGFKYVLQKFSQVTILYPGMTIFVDVVSNTQSMCPYKLQQPMVMNVCPVDSFQYQLLFTEFPVSDLCPPPVRKFKLVDVSTGELKCELEDAGISQARFVSSTTLVYFSRNNFVVFDIVSKKERSRFSNFNKSDVVAMDCSPCMGDSGRPLVVTVGRNGSIVVWNYDTGKIEAEGRISDPCFSLGYAYCVQCFAEGGVFQIAVSDDYGVYYVELRKSLLALTV
jgi:hypothetical protein